MSAPERYLVDRDGPWQPTLRADFRCGVSQLHPEELLANKQMNVMDINKSLPVLEDEPDILQDALTLDDAFAAFDADGDGKLTEEEVVAALTRKTSSGTELSEEAARATWKRWVEEFDLNKDGKISIEELTSAIETFSRMGGD